MRNRNLFSKSQSLLVDRNNRIKTYIMGRNIGIWMDSDKAFLIEDGKDKITTIESEVEHFHLHGGAKAKTPYGAQDATSETKLLARKKMQLKRYFDNVIEHLDSSDNIVVFGPAETKNEFKKEISQNTALKSKLIDAKTAHNKLSDKQLKEWVRNYYNE